AIYPRGIAEVGMQLKLGQPFRRVVHDVVIKSTTSGSDSVAISRIEKFVRLDEVRSDRSDLEEEEENHEVDEEHLAQAQKLPHMKTMASGPALARVVQIFLPAQVAPSVRLVLNFCRFNRFARAFFQLAFSLRFRVCVQRCMGCGQARYGN